MSFDSVNISKHKMLLEIINQIFKKNNIKEINNLTDFIDVDRDIIVAEKEMFEGMLEKVFQVFDKKKCGWERKKTVKNYILTFFRCATNDLGYVFQLKEKDITEQIGTKKYRRTHMLYSIVKK